MEAGVSSEFAEAVREIGAARESDVVERALGAAREQLGMDAAYIATVDQTYCARMLNGEIPNIVPDTAAEPALRNVTAIRNIADA